MRLTSTFGSRSLNACSPCSVLYDQEAKHHRDAGNEEIPNVILKASSFEGGELWIEDPLGPDVMDLDCRKIAGVITPFQSNMVEFDAKTALRTTMSIGIGNDLMVRLSKLLITGNVKQERKRPLDIS